MGVLRKASPAQSGSGQLYMPTPLARMSAVLNPFWDEYAHRREAGMDPDEAVEQSLTALLPSDQVDEVLAMLRGELDQRFSIIDRFNGRKVKSGLIATGDKTWHEFQALPDWPN